MSKSRVGFWLLISLMPTGIITFISFIVSFVTGYAVDEGEDPSAAAVVSLTLFCTFFIYWLGALLTGVGLKVWGKIDTRRILNEAQG